MYTTMVECFVRIARCRLRHRFESMLHDRHLPRNSSFEFNHHCSSSKNEILTLSSK
jgi:hypothetical protein